MIVAGVYVGKGTAPCLCWSVCSACAHVCRCACFYRDHISTSVTGQACRQATAAWLLVEREEKSLGLKVHKILLALNLLWFLVDKYLLILRGIEGRGESELPHNLLFHTLCSQSLLLSAAAWWPLGLATLSHQSFILCSFGQRWAVSFPSTHCLGLCPDIDASSFISFVPLISEASHSFSPFACVKLNLK